MDLITPDLQTSGKNPANSFGVVKEAKKGYYWGDTDSFTRPGHYNQISHFSSSAVGAT